MVERVESAPMWKLLQFAIFSAVVLSNVGYEWTPNPIVAGGLGIAAAYVVTLALVLLSRLLRRLRGVGQYAPSRDDAASVPGAVHRDLPQQRGRIGIGQDTR